MNDRRTASDTTQDGHHLQAFYESRSPVTGAEWRPAGCWARAVSPLTSNYHDYVISSGVNARTDGGATVAPSGDQSADSATNGGRQAEAYDAGGGDAEQRAVGGSAKRATTPSGATDFESAKPEYNDIATTNSEEVYPPRSHRSGKENREIIAEKNKTLPPKKRTRLH